MPVPLITMFSAGGPCEIPSPDPAIFLFFVKMKLSRPRPTTLIANSALISNWPRDGTVTEPLSNGIGDRRYFDSFGHLADFESEVDARRLLHLQLERSGGRPESGRLDAHGV